MYKHKNGITLRKIEFYDLTKLKELKNESWFGTHNINILNDYEQNIWFEKINWEKNMFLIAYSEKEKVDVGVYKIQNIDWINRKYDSAHDIFKESRGKGYSKPVLEAGIDFGFEILNINRIDTEVLENNIASLKSALHVGFVKEGVKRKSINKCNEYLDSIFLGSLREEWVKLRKNKYNGVCNNSYKPKNNI